MDWRYEWKKVPGFDKYLISEIGVWSDNNERMMKPKFEKRQGNKGRKYYRLRKNGKQHEKQFARWYMLAFHPRDNSDRLHVDHVNGNHTDDRPENLRWVSRSQNSRNSKVNGQYSYKFISEKKERGHNYFVFLIQHRGPKNTYKRFNKKKYKLVDALAYRNWYCLVNNIELIDRC